MMENQISELYESMTVLEAEEAPLTKEQRIREAVPGLLSWYRKEARVLPWRSDPTPYHVWLSEIMLQQTRVSAVIGYYKRFLESLPTVQTLAEAPEDQLLKLWEGLGYYSRVRNLKRAAGVVMEQYNGVIPDNEKELRKLPGIGPYTAGAIASIAYGQAVPAVDGNVLRVISRLLALREDIAAPSSRKRIEELLTGTMPEKDAGAFNQALMEIGACVCIPNGRPLCLACPMQGLCLACRRDLTDQIPVKSPKTPRRIEEKTVLVVRSGAQVLIRKRPEKGLLAGLYELPNVEGKLDERMAAETVGAAVRAIRPLGEAKHIFTHVEWHMTGYEIEPEPQALSKVQQALSAFPAETEKLRSDYALPGAFKAYTAALLKESIDKE